jgi:hypothetical protein
MNRMLWHVCGGCGFRTRLAWRMHLHLRVKPYPVRRPTFEKVKVDHHHNAHSWIAGYEGGLEILQRPRISDKASPISDSVSKH